ncbi:hypothetical protein HOLleu_24193 [Holothuria leucospilota]|uniref:Uncharacterized protein n=1 Tax=Holothuria leucospilota TaxID=206669 RepID=A0A9Q1BWB9_HOLLE|nr:hypothetical protein HOLleu_24193 [Holothuria leucospilota]
MRLFLTRLFISWINLYLMNNPVEQNVPVKVESMKTEKKFLYIVQRVMSYVDHRPQRVGMESGSQRNQHV